ncbi:protein FAM210B, mitochondrial [Ornithorhynchus anatinus]|uniref:Family with sequence similarity 210 member B n=1 Tax=Ornithorhynchus anatinus TaxID=9258 RepID=A0A6I8NU37_ORNAN|nr:protein FAM210B, mitochondrial [Ornithorhynchus anatinus]
MHRLRLAGRLLRAAGGAAGPLSAPPGACPLPPGPAGFASGPAGLAPGPGPGPGPAPLVPPGSRGWAAAARTVSRRTGRSARTLLRTPRSSAAYRLQSALIATTDPSKMTAPSNGDEQKPSKSQQLKKIFKEYGAVGVSFHIGISLMSLGIFYLVVSSGVDVPAILVKIGFKESFVQSKVAAGTSTFVVAYAIHKLLAPMRISITIISVPLIVRYFRKVGFFKPPASNP